MRWPTKTWMCGGSERSCRADFPVVPSFDDRQDYAFLSNFWPAPVRIDHVVWPTTEHYFQAMKASPSDKARGLIRAAKTPGEAKRLGQRVQLRKDWEKVKVNVMLVALRNKFRQHPDLAARLLATGGALLVEGNTWSDRVWGVVDGEGENLLGLLLMVVRAELRLKEGR
jgi:N-glycosidase YbiA